MIFKVYKGGILISPIDIFPLFLTVRVIEEVLENSF